MRDGGQDCEVGPAARDWQHELTSEGPYLSPEVAMSVPSVPDWLAHGAGALLPPFVCAWRREASSMLTLPASRSSSIPCTGRRERPEAIAQHETSPRLATWAGCGRKRGRDARRGARRRRRRGQAPGGPGDARAAGLRAWSRPTRVAPRCAPSLRQRFAVILMDVRMPTHGRLRDGQADPGAEPVRADADHLSDRVRA